MKLMINTTLAAILILGWVIYCKVDSLKCYECNSLHDHNCLTASLQPKECDDHQAKFCIKLVGFYSDEGTLIIRMCSKDDNLQDGCSVQIIEGIRTNVCFHKCYNDSCNSTNNITPSIFVMLISSLLSLCS